ncbi:MAG: type II toxin-antitoxin system HicA family toxin [Eubacteriales bacterium]|nr:type II toxin-antitoxin system HicA family toxin [Eubacteriales bacterium]MDD3073279.1 type II toxin-antitoxin system HicA family toxin [Eubacteriales bacterium]MDD4078863.1 type II toxin-antitoxin system HicA family toxin [Eubacteriales bacterium]MDD4768829.1 type II toxin-antitoxin system HicA family toxin [Eubacteriales bacterium]
MIQALIRDGWYIVDTTGSHVHLKNQNKPGKVTVPHPRKDLTKKTLQSIINFTGITLK